MLVVIEGGGQTAFGIIVHFLGANLEFDDLFVWRDDCGVEGLVAVLLRGSNVVFETPFHRLE